ncbi:MAG: DNA topoisomerase IV subunit B, partial [Nocardioides sp.]|nr:DNA topoisomerase IV subunit B [Nocardioides sp.]
MGHTIDFPEQQPSRTPQEHVISDNTYNAAHLLVLEGLEAVRKRPGMYIGSTDTRGLMHCLWEIIDNGVDEALAGVAGRVEVTLHDDGSVEVFDDGRGIPTDKEPRTGLPGVEVVATKLHAGGKFGGGSYNATGGLHGVGLSVVNALSARMDIDVDRSPAQQGMSFRRGVPGVFDGDGPKASFTPQSGLSRKGKRVGKDKHGTHIRFWPDMQIFTKDARVELEGLLGRARQTSFIVPGLELVIRDQRSAEPSEEKFRHDGGIAEFVEFLAKDEPVTSVLRLQGQDKFTETVPMLDDTGQMTPQDVERDLIVDVAARWGSGYDTEIRSFVNVIATPKGGTHVTGFEGAVTKAFNDAMRTAKVLKVADKDVIKEDVLEGLTAVVTVRLAEPQFEGQTKEILGTPAARNVVRKVVLAELGKFLTDSRGAQKQQAKLVMEKVLGAQKTRLTLRQQKENQRRKNALESSALPAKLADCRTSDERAELFIVEGDSALGTAKL